MKNRQDDLDEFEQDEEDDIEEETPKSRKRGAVDADGELIEAAGSGWKGKLRLGLSVVTLLGGAGGGAGYWQYAKSHKASLVQQVQSKVDEVANADGTPKALSDALKSAQQQAENFGNAAQDAVQQTSDQLDQTAGRYQQQAQNAVDDATAQFNQTADRYGQAANDALQQAAGGLPQRPSDIGPPPFDETPPAGSRYATTDPASAGPPVEGASPVEPATAGDAAASEPATDHLGASPPPPMNNPFANPAAEPATPAEPAATAANGEWSSSPATEHDVAASDPNSIPVSSPTAPPAEFDTPTASSRRGAAVIPIETAGPPDAIPMKPTAAEPGAGQYAAPAQPLDSPAVAGSDYRNVPSAAAQAVPMTPTARPAAPRTAPAAVPGTYTVQSQDNYWTISQKLYGNGGYFKALFEHNRDQHPRAKGLKAGDVIATPPADELAARYPDLVPASLRPAGAGDVRGTAAAPAATPTGPREYVVREGDTLFDIARYELGNAARWSEIYELNKQALGENVDKLTPGTRLQLPGNDGSAMSFRRGAPAGGSRYQR